MRETLELSELTDIIFLATDGAKRVGFESFKICFLHLTGGIRGMANCCTGYAARFGEGWHWVCLLRQGALPVPSANSFAKVQVKVACMHARLPPAAFGYVICLGMNWMMVEVLLM